MRTTVRPWLSVLVLAACNPVVGSPPDLDAVLDDVFAEYTIVELTDDEVAAMAQTGTLALPVADEVLQLSLVPRDLRAATYRAMFSDADGLRSMGAPALLMFKGTVGGDPATQVRLALADTGLSGSLLVAGERYYVEPARTYLQTASRGTVVVYPAGAALASTVLAPEPLEGQVQTMLELVANEAQFGVNQHVIELATDADHAFVIASGGATQANAEILRRLNVAEGVFEAELGITFDVVIQHAWTTADPYGDASRSELLASFTDTWEARFPRGEYPRDLAHLFSARPVIARSGIAKRDDVCESPHHGYGISGVVADTSARVVIAAHELALGLGATQREDCAQTLMARSLGSSTSLTFCAASRAEIGTAVAAHGVCFGTPIEPMPVLTSQATPLDFDGDGRANLAVFRPSDATWYHSTPTGIAGVAWGLAGDRLAPADYDGDKIADHAIVRDGVWWRRSSVTGSHDAIAWGLPTDVPVPADFDGDGKADVAIYRPEGGQWWVLHSSDGEHHALAWGAPDDVPVVGDFDGDRRADYIVFRPSDSTWYLLSSATFTVSIVPWGQAGDVPVAADFDGDLRLDLAVYRPLSSSWHILHSSDGGQTIELLGQPGDIPVPADYDGNGRADLATFRPSTSVWYSRDEASVTPGTVGIVATPFGMPGDVPLAAR